MLLRGAELVEEDICHIACPRLAADVRCSRHAACEDGLEGVHRLCGGPGRIVTVRMRPLTLLGIAVTPANPSLAKGLTQQFTAMGT